MPRLDNAIDVNAAPETVFTYVSSVAAQAEWVKWAKSVEVLSSEPGGVGSTDAMVMQVGPRKENVEGIITAYKDGQFIGRRLTRGMSFTESLSLVGFGSSTKVAWSVEYTPPMGALGLAMDVIFMARLFDQLMKDSLVILKERLEAPAVDGR